MPHGTLCLEVLMLVKEKIHTTTKVKSKPQKSNFNGLALLGLLGAGLIGVNLLAIPKKPDYKQIIEEKFEITRFDSSVRFIFKNTDIPDTQYYFYSDDCEEGLNNFWDTVKEDPIFQTNSGSDRKLFDAMLQYSRDYFKQIKELEALVAETFMFVCDDSNYLRWCFKDPEKSRNAIYKQATIIGTITKIERYPEDHELKVWAKEHNISIDLFTRLLWKLF